MREDRIRANKLGLKTGDCLTFNDGETRVRIVAIQECYIWVALENPESFGLPVDHSDRLVNMTFRLTEKYVSQNECLDLWWFDKQTLKQRYLDLQTEKTEPLIAPRAVRKSVWVKDIRSTGNLFYTESCFRFLKNFFSNYNSPLEDNDAFLHIGITMGMEKRMDTFYSCTTDIIRTDLERREYGRIKDPPNEEPKDLLMALYRHPNSNAMFRRKLLEWLDYAQKAIVEWQNKTPDPVKKKYWELRTLFDLSDTECDILLLAALMGCRILPCDDFRNQGAGVPNSKIIKRALLLGISESEYLNAIKKGSKLRRFDCLVRDGDLNPELLPFINGMNDEPLASRYFKKYEDEVLPWSYFGSLGEKHGSFIKSMIAGRSQNRGINILLYGEPGTGKTSFARALAKELGYTAYTVSQTNDYQREQTKRFRFAAVQVCASQVEQMKSIMIVDEADKMLEGTGAGEYTGMCSGGTSGSGDKGEINDILDTLKTPCIWITNSRSSQLDASNRRRFDYSIQFDKLTHEQRKMIWRNVVMKHQTGETVTDAMIEKLSATYEVNAGGISLAVMNYSDMLKNGEVSASETETVLKQILDPHCKLLNIKDDSAARMRVAQDYSMEGLNIKGSMKLDQIVDAVRRFQEEQRDEQSKGIDRPRMNLLLSGPPGTGKTEFVKYLGTTLGTRVVTRMGSDLLDKYVGGTEQNIKQCFEEASREKAILFLDEIDGMIQSRERAQRSWEVTQVNELLHQMENFDGILIGATNFVTNLDPATLRRFTFKLEFDCLQNAGKIHFFKQFFAQMNIGELSAVETQRLNRIASLTPGDFRTVRQSLYYLATTVTTDQILEGLERESLAKRQGLTQGRIGFG